MFTLKHDYSETLLTQRFETRKDAELFQAELEDGYNWSAIDLDNTATAKNPEDSSRNYLVWEMQDLPTAVNYKRPDEIMDVQFVGPYLCDAPDEVVAAQTAMTVTKRIGKYIAVEATLVDFTVNLRKPHKSVKGFIGNGA